jgi:FixJ family two-component response regulator
MTGAALATKLLGIRPDTPIILCTGFSEVISEKKAKSVGIRGYVMKPVVQTQIANTIRQVLDQEKET